MERDVRKKKKYDKIYRRDCSLQYRDRERERVQRNDWRVVVVHNFYMIS